MASHQVKLRYFAIVLLPICIFAIHELIHQHFIAVDLDVPLAILHDERPWLEAVGRFRFLAASWFFVSLTLLPVALLVRKLVRPMDRSTRVAAIVTTLAIVLLAVAPTIQQHVTSSTPRIYHQVGKAVFEAALSQGSLPGCKGPDDSWILGTCGEIPVFSLFMRILDIINAFAGLAVGALIVGMILCLETDDTNSLEDAAAQLGQNFRQMRQQLYLTSLILTFGMFFAASWMYWPMPMISDGERAAYNSLVTASALFTGTYFCLLMLSFYLPVAFILESRVKRLAGTAALPAETKNTIDVDAWRASHGLKEGTSDVLRAGFALAAPILAAFAGGITPFAQ
ncbi:hypothetical protein SAMN05444358_1185 [Ruegeria halocynthiae]|uniref:Uncharacterized protein n=1 Tax=Ruegeria halocynthiae TaxID=985054 RepID=A0A1H3FUG9_9RHOB|nr:hypothetical protein SAMN05444358_1185 [Ruegeria halocynthiae]